MDHSEFADLKVDVGAALVRRQVVDQLRRAIVQGRFAPGDHLSDRVLQNAFQVSRTVVREAVRQLEAEGLIETLAHRGSFVKVLSVRDAEQIYAVRSVLEGLAAREFVRNGTEAQIAELDRVLGEIRKNLEAPTERSVVTLKQDFYDVLLAGCGNSYVQNMLNQLFNRITQLRSMSLSAPARLPTTVAELEALMRAFRARDEEAAWAATLQHVRGAAEVALRLLRESAPAGR